MIVLLRNSGPILLERRPLRVLLVCGSYLAQGDRSLLHWHKTHSYASWKTPISHGTFGYLSEFSFRKKILLSCMWKNRLLKTFFKSVFDKVLATKVFKREFRKKTKNLSNNYLIAGNSKTSIKCFSLWTSFSERLGISIFSN